MTEKEQELHAQIAEMESDIKTVVEMFAEIAKSLGINIESLKDSSADDIGKQIPAILQNVIVKFSMGTFDTSSIAKFTVISPILGKYKYLVEDIIPKS